MRTIDKVVVACAAAAVVVLAVRARELTDTPPFEIHVPLHRRPQLELRGVNLSFDTDAGRLRVRAERAAPASPRVADFVVGPPQALAMRDVEVTLDSSGRGLRAKARDAELREDELLLQQAQLVPGKQPPEQRNISIDLATGVVRDH